MSKTSFIIFAFKCFFACTNVFGQQNFNTSKEQTLLLTPDQELALFWYNSLSDSSNMDSVLRVSETPFNWNDDTTISTQNDLKGQIANYLTRVGRRPIIIDSIFDSPDGLKQFKNADLSAIAVIEIWFYPRNNLRTHSMLIAINKLNHQKVVGFKLEGSLLRRRRQ